MKKEDTIEYIGYETNLGLIEDVEETISRNITNGETLEFRISHSPRINLKGDGLCIHSLSVFFFNYISMTTREV